MRCGGYTREHFHVFTPLLTALVMFWASTLRDDEMQDAVKPTGTCWRGVRISKHTEVHNEECALTRPIFVFFESRRNF